MKEIHMFWKISDETAVVRFGRLKLLLLLFIAQNHVLYHCTLQKTWLSFSTSQTLLSGHLYADNDIVANFYVLYEKCELNKIFQCQYFCCRPKYTQDKKIQSWTNYEKITMLCCLRPSWSKWKPDKEYRKIWFQTRACNEVFYKIPVQNCGEEHTALRWRPD